MEFTLVDYGEDATIRLVYEDRLEGKDREFLLTLDGLAFEATYNDGDDGGQEELTPVNLVRALYEMFRANT